VDAAQPNRNASLLKKSSNLNSPKAKFPNTNTQHKLRRNPLHRHKQHP
jgi:hypothetical protein